MGTQDAPPAAEAGDVDASVLAKPCTLGPFQLTNRLVYAPLTRCRAAPTGEAQPAAATYYAQRAAPGTLLISEATGISDTAQGYPCVPRVYTPAHVTAWKPVVEAVHAKGGVFFCQLWHVGRASHNEYQPGGAAPVSASATPFDGVAEFPLSPNTFQPLAYPTPRALSVDEIQGVVADYARAAQCALDAGFDGVEIHGANGYLIDQFLKKRVNTRTDRYGGSIENRCRFALEVVQAVVGVVGGDRVGIRLSPFGAFLLGAVDDDSVELNLHLVAQLNQLGVTYIHCIEPRMTGGNEESADYDQSWTLAPFRKAWQNTFIAAGGFTRERAVDAIASGDADLVAIGRWWLANPDLPSRWQAGAPLNRYDRATFYAGGAKGYTDYPTLDEVTEGTPTETHYSGVVVFKAAEKADG